MSNYRQNAEIVQQGKKIRALWVDERQAFDLRTTGAYTGWGSRHMAKWDGGADKVGTFRTSVWEKIAEFCKANHIPPTELVQSLFYRVMHAPQPNMGHGQYALSKWLAYKEPGTRQEIRTDILNTFESNKAYTSANICRLQLYGGLSESDALQKVALDATNVLTPLFRYCILKGLDRPIAANYLDAALYTYSRHPDLYNEVWGAWIPQELKDRTAEIQKMRGV